MPSRDHWLQQKTDIDLPSDSNQRWDCCLAKDKIHLNLETFVCNTPITDSYYCAKAILLCDIPAISNHSNYSNYFFLNVVPTVLHLSIILVAENQVLLEHLLPCDVSSFPPVNV